MASLGTAVRAGQVRRSVKLCAAARSRSKLCIRQLREPSRKASGSRERAAGEVA